LLDCNNCENSWQFAPATPTPFYQWVYVCNHYSKERQKDLDKTVIIILQLIYYTNLTSLLFILFAKALHSGGPPDYFLADVLHRR
jgi:hypothetical protein